ncbi:MAG: hypothetical protein ACP6IU_07250 [Candidatus Asgardarchaeia archaeon]
MSSLNRYYSVLMTKIPYEISSLISRSLDRQIKNLPISLGEFSQRYAEDFVKLISKIVAYHRDSSSVNLTPADVSTACLFWVYLLERFRISEFLATKEFLPIYPRRVGIKHYSLLLLKIELSPKASKFLEHRIQRKRNFLLSQGFEQYDITKFLATFNTNIIAISKLIAVEKNQPQVQIVNVKEAEQFIKALFFKLNHHDFTLLHYVIDVAKKDIFRKLNAINVSLDIGTIIDEFGILQSTSNTFLRRIMASSLNISSRMVAFKRNRLTASKKDCTDGLEYLISYLNKEFSTSLSLNLFKKVLMRMNNIDLETLSKPQLDLLKEWISDIIKYIDSQENYLKYRDFINLLYDFVIFLALFSATVNKQKHPSVNNMKIAIEKFANFILKY